MQSFRDRFNNHPVHKQVETIDKEISGIRSTIPRDPENDVRNDWARFIHAFRYVKRTLRAVDPTLATTTILSRLKESLEQLRVSVSNFAKSRDVSAVNAHMDTVLDRLRELPGLGILYSPVVQDEIDTLEQEHEEFMSELASERSTLTTQFEKLKSHADTLATQVREHQKQLEQEKGRIDELINAEQKRYQEAERGRTEQIQAAVEATEERAGTALRKTVEEWERIANLRLEKMQSMSEEMSDHESKTREMVGIISNSAVSGLFAQRAQKDQWGFQIMRGLAILSFVFAIGVVASLVWQIHQEDLRWEILLIRLIVPLTALLPAYYCAREAEKHRVTALRNQQIGMELASFPAYLEVLGADDRKAIIRDKVDDWFGGKNNAANVNDVPSGNGIEITREDVVALAERLIKACK